MNAAAPIPTRVISWYNLYHLGDNIFNVIFFNLIGSYCVANNVYIRYYLQSAYIGQVSEFVQYPSHVSLYSLSEKPEEGVVELWQNSADIGYSFADQHAFIMRFSRQTRVAYNEYYATFFNVAMEKAGIRLRISNFYYKDRDLIVRYKRLKRNAKYRRVDVLVVNSQPLSGQFTYVKEEWDAFIRAVAREGWRVVATTPLGEGEGEALVVPCTSEDGLSVKDIAAVSIRARVIVAVNSGVVPGLLNKYTLNNVRKFYVFDDRCRFSYPRFENREKIGDITVDEIRSILEVPLEEK